MNILLTGASSFTGLWFAEALHRAGHKVVAPLRGSVKSYDGIRGTRVARLANVAEIIPGVSFGDPGFLSLIQHGRFDVLAHHGAQVTNYRSLDFDIEQALSQNCNNIRSVLEIMASNGLTAVVSTSSVFECDTGTGDMPLEAFSPYGLSKHLTYQTIRFWARRIGAAHGRFIIPNPFGPYEEPRFCNYLLKCWYQGEPATVQTPLYVRDNIPADLLALVYARFVEKLVQLKQDSTIGPGLYVESQGVFAERLAREMRPRLGLSCETKLFDQTEFAEPAVRVNLTRIDGAEYGWDEALAWTRLADYYRQSFQK